MILTTMGSHGKFTFRSNIFKFLDINSLVRDENLPVARVKLEPESSSCHEPSSSRGPTFIFLFLFFFLLF